jgi:hypothetical protein
MVNNESLKIAELLKGLGPDQLIGVLRNPPPGVPLYLAMGEQMRRQNMQKQALAQPQGPMPQSTVVDDFASGIAGTPEMSLGGVDTDNGIASLASAPPGAMQMPGGLGAMQMMGQQRPPMGGQMPQQFYKGGRVESGIRDINDRLREGAQSVRSVLAPIFGAQNVYPRVPAQWVENSDLVQALPVDMDRGTSADVQAIPLDLDRDIPKPRPLGTPPEEAPIQPPQMDPPQAHLPVPPPEEAPIQPPQAQNNGPAAGAPAAGGLTSIAAPEPWVSPKQDSLELNLPDAPKLPALDEFLARMNEYNPDAVTPEMLKRLEKKEAALEEARAKAGPMALLQTGLAILAGNSKRGLENIARGGLAGLQGWAETQQGYNSRQDELDEMRMKLLAFQQKNRMDNLNSASGMRRDEATVGNQQYDNAVRAATAQYGVQKDARDFEYGAQKDERDFNQRDRHHRQTLGAQQARAVRAEKREELQERKLEEQNRRAAVAIGNQALRAEITALTNHMDYLGKPAEVIRRDATRNVLERMDPTTAAYWLGEMGNRAPKPKDVTDPAAPPPVDVPKNLDREKALQDARAVVAKNPALKAEVNRRLQAAGLPPLP